MTTVDSPGVSSTRRAAPPALLAVTAEEVGTTVRLAVAGVVDFCSRGPVRHALADALARRPSAVVVDLSGTRLLDSSGAALLEDARRDADAAGIRLTVVNCRPLVRLVFDLTGRSHALVEPD